MSNPKHKKKSGRVNKGTRANKRYMKDYHPNVWMALANRRRQKRK